VTEPSRIRKRLARIRRDGYAWTDQELDLEVNGLAAPIVDVAGTTIAVATLYGPSYRFAEQLSPELGSQFAAFARGRTAAVSG
jgi:DNA-binding IclR family transcriptional regulator